MCVVIIWVFTIALPFIAIGWIIKGEYENFNILTTILVLVVTFGWIYCIYMIMSGKSRRNQNDNINQTTYKEIKKTKSQKPKYHFPGEDNSFKEGNNG